MAPSAAPARISRSGRSLITRAELARLSGLSPSALAALYAQRGRTGHPPAAEVDPVRRALYFDEKGRCISMRNWCCAGITHAATQLPRPGLRPWTSLATPTIC